MIKDENGTYFDRPIPSYDHKEFVPLEVKSGGLVIIHGDLVHKRWSYAFVSHLFPSYDLPFHFLFNNLLCLFFVALRIFLQHQDMHWSCM
jgi:hypothetical protein